MLLRAHNVHRSFGDNVVLDGIDLVLGRGESVALIGPNGSGKSTLMGMLVGIDQPDSGSVVQETGRIGWVPQRPAIYRRLTVLENLRVLGDVVTGTPIDRAQAELALTEAGLIDWRDHQAWQLSGGLQQRLNLAIGLLGEPVALVLDEPTTGVDLNHTEVVWSLLERRRERGAALLFATHTVREARRADRILVLVGGHVAYEGPLEDIARFAREGHFESVNDPIERGMLTLWQDADRAPGTLGDA